MIFLQRSRRYITKNSYLNGLSQGINKNHAVIKTMKNGKKTGPYIRKSNGKTYYMEYDNNLLHGISLVINNDNEVIKYANFRYGVLHGRCIVVYISQYYNYGEMYAYCDYTLGYTTCVKRVSVYYGSIMIDKNSTDITISSYLVNTSINLLKHDFYNTRDDKPYPNFKEIYNVRKNKTDVTYKKCVQSDLLTVLEYRIKKNKIIYYKKIEDFIEYNYKFNEDNDVVCNEYNYKIETIKRNDFALRKLVAHYKWDTDDDEVINIKVEMPIQPSVCQSKIYKFKNNVWLHINGGDHIFDIFGS